jgi:geranylgeranyl diphosphate synthase type II
MQTLEKFQALINQKIEGFCRKNGDERILQPVNYILQLGGKRVRPMLTLLAADAFTDELEPAVYPAIALEIFHNFTLMHDDIMDNAPLRRGHPTVHEHWNRDVAILSGDAMLIQAYQLIIKTKSECLPSVMQTFNTTALEVCQGQQLDMDFQSRTDVSAEEYIEMIRLKTSVLLGGAMKIGAIIGGASEEDQKHLYDFAIALGLSFQLWDDYLDTYGDGSKTGKQVGGDILANKKTLLSIKALENASEEERDLIVGVASTVSSEEKIARVKDVYAKYRVAEFIKTTAGAYHQTALDKLEALSIAAHKKEGILQLVDQLKERTH